MINRSAIVALLFPQIHSFINGEIQLPGAKRELIDDVVKCTQLATLYLNYHLHAGESNPALMSRIININPVMKNYGCSVKMPINHLIDIEVLRQLTDARLKLQVEYQQSRLQNKLVSAATTNIFQNIDLFAQNSQEKSKFLSKLVDDATPAVMQNRAYIQNVMPKPYYNDIGPIIWPVIHSTKYTRNETTLTIKFRTPTANSAMKRTRVKIFQSGKINILGAIDSVDTYIIINWLQWIFEKNHADLIVLECSKEIYVPWRPDNVIMSNIVPELSIITQWREHANFDPLTNSEMTLLSDAYGEYLARENALFVSEWNALMLI
jgi:hypothetical protein